MMQLHASPTCLPRTFHPIPLQCNATLLFLPVSAPLLITSAAAAELLVAALHRVNQLGLGIIKPCSRQSGMLTSGRARAGGASGSRDAQEHRACNNEHDHTPGLSAPCCSCARCPASCTLPTTPAPVCGTAAVLWAVPAGGSVAPVPASCMRAAMQERGAVASPQVRRRAGQATRRWGRSARTCPPSQPPGLQPASRSPQLPSQPPLL